MPKFSDCRLVHVDIPYYILKCSCCGEKTKVVPSFITEGTTLTLVAQAMVVIMYHQSDKQGWRILQDILCPNNGISHTTLYRAYNNFGNLLKDSPELLNEVATECLAEYWEITRRARKEKTKEIENINIQVLLMVILEATKKICFRKTWKLFWNTLELLKYHRTQNENIIISNVNSDTS